MIRSLFLLIFCWIHFGCTYQLVTHSSSLRSAPVKIYIEPLQNQVAHNLSPVSLWQSIQEQLAKTPQFHLSSKESARFIARIAIQKADTSPGDPTIILSPAQNSKNQRLTSTPLKKA